MCFVCYLCSHATAGMSPPELLGNNVWHQSGAYSLCIWVACQRKGHEGSCKLMGLDVD